MKKFISLFLIVLVVFITEFIGEMLKSVKEVEE